MWAVWGLKYLCHCNENNSGRIVKLCAVESLQQVDLCEQSLGAGALQGHLLHAALQSWIFWGYFCARQLSCLWCDHHAICVQGLQRIGPSQRLVSGLRFWHSSAELTRDSPTHFQSEMNVYVNVDVLFGACCSGMKALTRTSDLINVNSFI